MQHHGLLRFQVDALEIGLHSNMAIARLEQDALVACAHAAAVRVVVSTDEDDLWVGQLVSARNAGKASVTKAAHALSGHLRALWTACSNMPNAP